MPVMSNRPGRVVIRDVSGANGGYVVVGNTASSNIAFGSETLTGANITKISWATNGMIEVIRGTTVIVRLHNSGEWDLSGIPLTANSAATINLNFTSSGSIVIEASKF